MDDTTPDIQLIKMYKLGNEKALEILINKYKKDVFRFVALQSDLGQDILKHIGINTKNIDSIILYQPGIAYYYKSEAAIEISRSLSGFFYFGNLFRIFPKSIANSIYDYVASNRYKWYGKRESCFMPTTKLNSKFL